MNHIIPTIIRAPKKPPRVAPAIRPLSVEELVAEFVGSGEPVYVSVVKVRAAETVKKRDATIAYLNTCLSGSHWSMYCSCLWPSSSHNHTSNVHL